LMLMMVYKNSVHRPLYTFVYHHGWPFLEGSDRPWKFSGRYSVSLIAVVLVPGSLNVKPTHLGRDMTLNDLPTYSPGSSLAPDLCGVIKKRRSPPNAVEEEPLWSVYSINAVYPLGAMVLASRSTLT
jgi:hypothetical protein